MINMTLTAEGFMFKKRYAIIIFIFLILGGSFINFYATNLLMSDIGNAYGGLIDNQIFATFPMWMLAFDFVLFTIYFARIYRHPNLKKKTTFLYSIILMSFSFVGILMGILSGILVYQSFVKPYPFPGYLILTFIFNGLFMLLGLAGLLCSIFVFKEDSEYRPIKKGYVFYSIFISVFIYFVYNRFGALLWSYTFMQISTLYLTWPFYLSLLFPLGVLVLFSFSIFNLYKEKGKFLIWSSIVIFALNFAFSIAYMIIAYNNTAFIAAVSPCMAISRLASMPIDAILSFLIVTLLPLFNIRYLRKHKGANKTVLSKEVNK